MIRGTYESRSYPSIPRYYWIGPLTQWPEKPTARLPITSPVGSIASPVGSITSPVGSIASSVGSTTSPVGSSVFKEELEACFPVELNAEDLLKQQQSLQALAEKVRQELEKNCGHAKVDMSETELECFGDQIKTFLESRGFFVFHERKNANNLYLCVSSDIV
jgi:hypothetical protein